jgi:hypothetical protein
MWANIPQDIFSLFLVQLLDDPHTILTQRLVCKRWNSHTTNDTFWKQVWLSRLSKRNLPHRHRPIYKQYFAALHVIRKAKETDHSNLVAKWEIPFGEMGKALLKDLLPNIRSVLGDLCNEIGGERPPVINVITDTLEKLATSDTIERLLANPPQPVKELLEKLVALNTNEDSSSDLSDA